MNKIKSFFARTKNKNIVFVLSLVLCAGVISYIALGTNVNAEKSVDTQEYNETTVTATMTWYKAGPDAYELDSEIADYENTSAAKAEVSTAKTSKASSAEDKTNSAVNSQKAPTVSVGQIKVNKTNVTTTVHKTKAAASKTADTTTAKKTKKKKKKTTTVQTTTTTAATTAYSPSKAASKTYKTRDISDETYTIKNAVTGKKIKSDGFDIVCQVVYGEIGSTWDDEAIKAQAVAAYTYIRYCKENGTTPVLAAKSGYGSRIEELVKSVEGLVCKYNGAVINAVFCASTAGCSADSQNVWGSSLPYLKSVDSKYDSAYDPNYGVTKTLSQAQVKKILEKQGVTLSNKPGNWIKVLSNYNGKYVGNVSIDGKKTLTGANIRTLMGLKSAAFTVKYSDGNFTFTTYGYGHGVGMSQWGAQLYASKGGYKFDQILKHYYRGISISL